MDFISSVKCDQITGNYHVNHTGRDKFYDRKITLGTICHSSAFSGYILKRTCAPSDGFVMIQNPTAQNNLFCPQVHLVPAHTGPLAAPEIITLNLTW